MPGGHFVGEDDGDYGPADTPTVSTDRIAVVTVPAGWDLLHAGPLRSVRVIKTEIGDPAGKPFIVIEKGRCNRVYAEVRVLGESALVHTLAPPSGEKGLACLETTSALLCKRDADYRETPK